MPKQNVSVTTKRKKVTFAKKRVVQEGIECIASRALDAFTFKDKVAREVRGILKKKSYKRKIINKKDVKGKKKSVRYGLDIQVQEGSM